MTPTNQILADRWRLVEFIGEGAMGEVWRGRHTVLGHDVAIKLMKPDAASDRELVARFKREARIAAQLRHKTLVRVEDFGVTSDVRPFLAMEHLRGHSLARRLEETPKPDRMLWRCEEGAASMEPDVSCQSLSLESIPR
jgi:serine/threonine-protein kinase